MVVQEVFKIHIYKYVHALAAIPRHVKVKLASGFMVVMAS